MVTAEKNSNNQDLESIDIDGFQKHIAETYGISADTPSGRIEQLKELSVEGVAIMLEDINRIVNRSDESMISDKVVKIGGKPTLAIEHRHAVFEQLMQDIDSADESVSPERIADVLALGIVLLHPFKDGNGRTARVIGMIFRDEYTSPEAQDDFNTVTTPRDTSRKRGGWRINGYIPKTDTDMTDPYAVSAYLQSLLREDMSSAYTSCFGEAPLHRESDEELSEAKSPLDKIYANYSEFANQVAELRKRQESIGSGKHSSVGVIEKDGNKYAVRLVEKAFLDDIDVTNDHVEASVRVGDISHMEKIVAASREEGVTIAEFIPGKHVYDMESMIIESIPDEHIDRMVRNRTEALKRGVVFDLHPGNVLYNPELGFTDIDFHVGTEDTLRSQTGDHLSSMVGVLLSLENVGKTMLEKDVKKAEHYEASGVAVRRRMIRYIENHFSQEDYTEIRQRWVTQIAHKKVGANKILAAEKSH